MQTINLQWNTSSQAHKVEIDAHRGEVILTHKEESEYDETFFATPSEARQIADALNAAADEIEGKVKP